MIPSGFMNLGGLVCTEIVSVLFAPLAVPLGESVQGELSNTIAMPELGYKIRPLLAAVRAWRTGKKPICIRESDIQQRNQIVVLHGLDFTHLLVLTVAGFQHKPSICRGDIARQREPMIQGIVRQLHSIFLVGLGPP